MGDCQRQTAEYPAQDGEGQVDMLSQAGSPIWGPSEEFSHEPVANQPRIPATQRTGGPASISQGGSDCREDDPMAG